MRSMVDLFKVPENERITIIVDCVKVNGRVSILLEDEKLEPGKIERYIGKVKALLPGVIAEVKPGPVANVSTVTFIKG